MLYVTYQNLSFYDRRNPRFQNTFLFFFPVPRLVKDATTLANGVFQVFLSVQIILFIFVIMESGGGRSQQNEKRIQESIVNEMIKAAERKLKTIAVGDSKSGDGPTLGGTSTTTTTTGSTDGTRQGVPVRVYTSASRTPNYIFDNPRRIQSERRRPKPYVRKKKEGKGECQEDNTTTVPQLLGSSSSSTTIIAPDDDGKSWRITIKEGAFCLFRRCKQWRKNPDFNLCPI